jgi:hypothetical protein
MVAGNQELAPQSHRELEGPSSADQLGPAQRARILVLAFSTGLGHLGYLFFLPTSV